MTDGDPGPEPEDIKTPWSFKLMVVAVVLYLGWRLVQLIDRIIDWLS